MSSPKTGLFNSTPLISATTKPKDGDPDALQRAIEAFAGQRRINLYYAVGLNILFLSIVLLRALFIRFSRSKLCFPALHTSHHHARPYYILKLPIFAITIPTAPQAFAIAVTSVLLAGCSCFSYSSRIFVPNPFFKTIASQWLRHSANRTGVLSFACLPPMILAVARKNYLVEATRWSYDSWNIFHRFLGRASLVLAAVHAALYCGYIVEKGDHFRPLWSYSYWNAGVVGTLTMCWLAGPPSVRWARQRNYEFFLALHVLMTISLLYLCFVHIFWMFSVEWLWGAVAVWGLDRAMRLWLSQGATAKATSEVRGEVIRLKVPVGPKKAMLKTPGQFVYLRFPELSWIQKHPFSIAGVREATALEVVDIGEEGVPLLSTVKQHQHLELTFTIRPCRGVTKALHALGTTTVQVAVEGAYKHHIPLPDDTVFFAAGVGFALVLGYLRARQGGRAYWAVGKSEDLWAFEELLAECRDGELDGLVINYSGVRMEHVHRLESLGIAVVQRRLKIQEVLDEWDQKWQKGGQEERAVMACGPERFLDECRIHVDALNEVDYWEEVSTK